MNNSNHQQATLIEPAKNFIFALIDSGSQISLEALDHTQRVIEQTNRLALRLSELQTEQNQRFVAQRQMHKQTALDICNDLTDIGSEAIRGLARLLTVASEEIHEVKRQHQDLFENLSKPVHSFSNPFRKSKSSSSGETTIIPISIQDN